MLKIMWFLKRADGISLEEFRAWWLDHTNHVREARKGELRKYVVNIREPSDTLAGQPPDDPIWDGVAEEWYEDEKAVNRAYSRPAARGTRQDTLAHVSRLSRIIVREREIPLDES